MSSRSRTAFDWSRQSAECLERELESIGNQAAEQWRSLPVTQYALIYFTASYLKLVPPAILSERNEDLLSEVGPVWEEYTRVTARDIGHAPPPFAGLVSNQAALAEGWRESNSEIRIAVANYIHACRNRRPTPGTARLELLLDDARTFEDLDEIFQRIRQEGGRSEPGAENAMDDMDVISRLMAIVSSV